MYILVVSTPAHQDSGFLTLLQTFGQPGLEIQLDDNWFSVQVSSENPLQEVLDSIGFHAALDGNKRGKMVFNMSPPCKLFPT